MWRPHGEFNFRSSFYFIYVFRPQCKTVSGPRVGAVCVFPFTFYNLTFTECTDFWHAPGGGDTLYWCATSSNPEPDNWGFCGQHCSNSSHLNTVTTTITMKIANFILNVDKVESIDR